jgi:hypothetical protein
MTTSTAALRGVDALTMTPLLASNALLGASAECAQTLDEKALVIYAECTERVFEGLIFNARQARGLTLRDARFHLEQARARVRTVLAPLAPAAVGAPASTPTAEQETLGLYEDCTARALDLLRANGAKTGVSAQATRVSAARLLRDLIDRVNAVRQREATRHATQAAAVAPGSDHWMRAHACVPRGAGGWIHRHLGLCIEREAWDTDTSWLRRRIAFVNALPAEAHRPGPGPYDASASELTP